MYKQQKIIIIKIANRACVKMAKTLPKERTQMHAWHRKQSAHDAHTHTHTHTQTLNLHPANIQKQFPNLTKKMGGATTRKLGDNNKSEPTKDAWHGNAQTMSGEVAEKWRKLYE